MQFQSPDCKNQKASLTQSLRGVTRAGHFNSEKGIARVANANCQSSDSLLMIMFVFIEI